MAEFAIFLMIAGPIVGAILILIGIIQLFSKDEIIRKKGTTMLLIGVCAFIVPLVIGFSICSSNFSLGGMH